MIPRWYRLRDYRYAITAVLTNKCPSGPYRAPMLICSWVTEGTIDAIARALGLDPVAVRRRNMLTDADLPYTTATELTYRSVYPRGTLERAITAADYDGASCPQAAPGRRTHRRHRSCDVCRAEHLRLGVLQDASASPVRPRRSHRAGSSRAAPSPRRSASSARARAT